MYSSPGQTHSKPLLQCPQTLQFVVMILSPGHNCVASTKCVLWIRHARASLTGTPDWIVPSCVSLFNAAVGTFDALVLDC